MTGVTQILASIERGDAHAAEQLLPLVYEELRKLAAVRLAQEQPGQTLQATALVHEAMSGRWMWRKPNLSTAAAISLWRPPRPCGEF